VLFGTREPILEFPTVKRDLGVPELLQRFELYTERNLNYRGLVKTRH
jgi:hypothetical protein